VVNHRATVGMRCVPGSVTLGGFLLTLMGPAPRYIRIIGLSLLVMSLILFAFMFRLACVLLEKWRHVHRTNILETIHLATGGSVANYVT
jgi:high-affinity Fe2+/Pb2+ permease